MEVLFFLIFGGLLLVFIAYGIKLYKEDKKILNEYKDQMDGQSLDRHDIPEEDLGFFCGEQPFVDRLESYN